MNREASKHPRRTGFTLLEVVLGLMLLSTLLVSVILASSRHNRMLRLASDRQLAVVFADEMMGTWHDSRDGIPLSSSGSIPGRPDMIWKTYVISNESVFGSLIPIVRFDVIRLEAFRDAEDRNSSLTLKSASNSLLVSVDTLARKGRGDRE